jgi:hypothetical protein
LMALRSTGSMRSERRRREPIARPYYSKFLTSVTAK